VDNESPELASAQRMPHLELRDQTTPSVAVIQLSMCQVVSGQVLGGVILNDFVCISVCLWYTGPQYRLGLNVLECSRAAGEQGVAWHSHSPARAGLTCNLWVIRSQSRPYTYSFARRRPVCMSAYS
jgi:hypothetical protein